MIENGISLKGTSKEEREQEIEELIGAEVIYPLKGLSTRVRIVKVEVKYGIPRAEIAPVSGGADTIWVYLDRLVR